MKSSDISEMTRYRSAEFSPAPAAAAHPSADRASCERCAAASAARSLMSVTGRPRRCNAILLKQRTDGRQRPDEGSILRRIRTSFSSRYPVCGELHRWQQQWPVQKGPRIVRPVARPSRNPASAPTGVGVSAVARCVAHQDPIARRLNNQFMARALLMQLSFDLSAELDSVWLRNSPARRVNSTSKAREHTVSNNISVSTNCH